MAGSCGQVALNFWESLKPQSLRLKDIRGPDHLQPAQLRYLWSPAQYPKLPATNHPETVPQPVPVVSCMCLGKPLLFFDVILLMLYKLFIILHSDVVETKHGVSKKDRTFKQNHQSKWSASSLSVYVYSMYVNGSPKWDTIPCQHSSILLLMPAPPCCPAPELVPRARLLSQRTLKQKQKDSTRLDDWPDSVGLERFWICSTNVEL